MRDAIYFHNKITNRLLEYSRILICIHIMSRRAPLRPYEEVFFVLSLWTSVVITEEYNVIVNNEALFLISNFRRVLLSYG